MKIGVHAYNNMVRKYKAQVDSEMEIHCAWQRPKDKKEEQETLEYP